MEAQIRELHLKERLVSERCFRIDRITGRYKCTHNAVRQLVRMQKRRHELLLQQQQQQPGALGG